MRGGLGVECNPGPIAGLEMRSPKAEGPKAEGRKKPEIRNPNPACGYGLLPALDSKFGLRNSARKCIAPR
jgi:hypothetical protein